MNEYKNLIHKAIEINNQNIARGWWTNINTGEDILKTRNRGELLSLVTSELSEASYGDENILMDDKLPQYPMFVVEIADAVIRAMDLIGAEIKIHNYSEAVLGDDSLIFNEINHSGFSKISIFNENINIALMKLTNLISQSVEHFRQGKHLQAVHALIGLVLSCQTLVNSHNKYLAYDFETIIDDKLKYNQKRIDHSIEHRKKNNGKKF